MHAETSIIDTPLFTPHRPGLRPLILVAIVATSLLAGCASRTAPAPVADQSNRGATAQASGTYVVKPGDTLYQIAQAHSMDVARLSQLNNITNPSQLAVGQVLRIDGGTAVSSGSTAAATSAATPIPITTIEQPKVDTSSQAGQRASDAGLISWGWPASGKIIQGFNDNTKGIDIEGAIGAPVQAAADGKVMYAGNGVRGLGNLILLGHTNGFITAYAHNQSLLVKTGDTVKKGAKIATIGQSDTTSPRLHFEVRRRGTPVNPLSYLPAR
ncbi:peptidoglycan DD-metalloendopeptidase family protein [Alcaligenaceae bacterium CGII-47]|nr:peptidoglycan DD-metalloendopeptidase family protein [Alcaligenaceae bacterium CGII-47]